MSKLFGSLVPEMNIKRKIVTRISEEESNIPYYDIPIYCKEVVEPKYDTINKIGRVELTKGLELDVYGSFEEPWFMGTDIIRLLDLKDVGKTIDNISSSMKDKFLTPPSTGGQTRGGFNGTQTAWFINEAGIYSKLATSRKPEAEKYMISIYDTLSKIRKRNGEFLFTDKSYNLYEEINSMFRDSRIGKKKVLELILSKTGIDYSSDDIFNKLLSDLEFVTLDNNGNIIGYKKEYIRCIDGTVNESLFYFVDYFKYEGIEKLFFYLSRNNMIIKENN